MQLILRRSQASTGFISKSVKFSLHAQAKLTEIEVEHVKKYKLGAELIYSKDRVGYNPDGGFMHNLAAAAAAITITVDDLVNGRTINCKDIGEMLAIVEQVKEACNNLKAILEASANFDGEEIIEY